MTRKNLFRAMCLPMTGTAGKGDKAVSDLGKQRRWYRTIITSFAVDRRQIRSRPDKAIAFAEHDPGTLIVQSEAAFGCGGNFNCLVIPWRWRMGDGQNPDNRGSVFQCRRDSQYENRTVLVALFPPLLKLPVPQIGKEYLKIQPTLGSPGIMLFFVQFTIEMLKACFHRSGFNSREIIFCQRTRQFDATLPSHQTQIILVSEQNSARATVLGNNNRIAHGSVLVSAKILGNGCGCYCGCQDQPPFSVIYGLSGFSASCKSRSIAQ